MRTLIGILFLLLSGWLVWVPWREYRHAVRTGAHRIPFSRMLMRLSVAGCVLALGLFFLLSAVILPGRSHLYEVLYWMGALFCSVIMLLAGLVDYLLVKRELLLGQKEIIQDFVRTVQTDHERREAEIRETVLPTENGHQPPAEA